MTLFIEPSSQDEMDREDIIGDLIDQRESDLQCEVEEQLDDYRCELEDMTDSELAIEYGERYGEILEIRQAEEENVDE